MIILNEKEAAEKCDEEGIIGNKPYATLTLLGKYYCQVKGLKKREIIRKLEEFMQLHYPNYEAEKQWWQRSIEKIAKNASRYPLFEISGVSIKESEYERIKEIRNEPLERLAFTLLCLAKYGNERSRRNNNWVNMDSKEIFEMARINCGAYERENKIGKLGRLELVEFAKNNTNLGIRLTFVNNEDCNERAFIEDFRELGYEYRVLNGENYIRCAECGALVKGNKFGNKKYCDKCSGYEPKGKKSVVCRECGRQFWVKAKDNKTCVCGQCKEDRRKSREIKIKQGTEMPVMDAAFAV